MARLEIVDGKKVWHRQTGPKHYFSASTKRERTYREVLYVSPVKFKPREVEWKKGKYTKRPERPFELDFTGDIGKAIRQAVKARIDTVLIRREYGAKNVW